MICYAEQDNLKPARGKSGQPVCVATLVGSFIGDNQMLDIMTISLSQGLFALVDGSNYEELSKYKWYAIKNSRTYYAARIIPQGRKTYMMLMHRQILGLLPQDGKMTDHINHCGLDNREINLRTCTNQYNQANRRLNINNTSGFKGVTWCKQNETWIAQIKYKQKNIYLGRSKHNPRELARRYDSVAKRLFGEFAWLNFKE